MTITKQEEDKKITLALEGWLDVESSPELGAYVKELPETDELVFDFEKLEYISSSGIREVVAAFRSQKSKGLAFRVIHVSPDVMDVFSMTGIDKKIDISGN